MMANSEGLADGMSPLEKKVTLHHSCHSRAQNMGTKSLEMLKLIPSIKINFVEKCSGHGGTFGVMKKTNSIANKIGQPVAKNIEKKIIKQFRLNNNKQNTEEYVKVLVEISMSDTKALAQNNGKRFYTKRLKRKNLQPKDMWAQKRADDSKGNKLLELQKRP